MKYRSLVITTFCLICIGCKSNMPEQGHDCANNNCPLYAFILHKNYMVADTLGG